jgi:hypothetical protein
MAGFEECSTRAFVVDSMLNMFLDILESFRDKIFVFLREHTWSQH